ncbi:MAG TPA: DUF368 domain-containing protein [Candidatus Coproplasma avicola]|uniref:DUF368 domain-containing protein n=1 Tax=Candidatus Coproplasma avicola TaxID=2840744 RepID=A0A9D1E720_9FIRM|nr:DUF368 domain-containing protein [Candidatus Coproplasma avicola]
MEETNTRPKQSGQEDKEELSLAYADKKEVAKGGVLGLFIGLAIIVPGVSGSAVAIIFRLYEKLLYAFGNLLKSFKKCVRFLLPIAIGAVIGLVVGFIAVEQLINLVMFAVVALFAGLMLGAFPAVTDQIKGEKITAPRAALFLIGLAVPIAFSAISCNIATGNAVLENAQWYHYILFLVLGYVIAITQLVPGLSATAILMMLGYFTPLINSISITYWGENPAVFIVYACLIVGFVAGLLTVSKGMSKLIEKWRATTFFTVAGMSLGSVITMFYNTDMLDYYAKWGGAFQLWELILGIVLFVGGIAAAYFFVRYERKHSK